MILKYIFIFSPKHLLIFLVFTFLIYKDLLVLVELNAIFISTASLVNIFLKFASVNFFLLLLNALIYY